MSFEELPTRDICLALTCIAICLLAISLPGCSASVPSPEPVTEPAAIKFVYPSDNIEKGYYEPFVQMFNERYPNVTVELCPDRWDDDYDVFVDPEWWILQLRRQEGIRSVETFFEIDTSFDLSDFYPSIVELFTTDGTTWAVPAGVDLLVMYYNQDLFDRYNVPYPEVGWTWQDFLERALALRDPAADVYGYVPWEDYMDSVNFIHQHGGQIFDDLQNPTRAAFDDPLAIEALEWYADLMHEHDVAPTPQQASSDFGMGAESDYGIGVVAGKAGMWIGPLSNQGGQTYARWNFRWGMLPLPRDAQAATQAWGWGYAIRSEAQNPEACWRWIAFLSEQMPNRLMPARRSLAESEAYEQLVGNETAAMARLAMEDATLVSYWTLWGMDGAGSEMMILQRAMRRIARGEATPQEAMNMAQQQAGD